TLSFDEVPELRQISFISRTLVEAERKEPASAAPQIARVGDVILGCSDAARECAHGAVPSKQLLVGPGQTYGQALHRLRPLTRHGRGTHGSVHPRSVQPRAASLNAVR